MRKITLETQALLVPVPVALVSVVGESGTTNILTASWISVVSGTPPMVCLAIRPERLSYAMVQETGEFVVNLPRATLLRAVDFCGTTSGREVDKFAEARLTPLSSIKVRPPAIGECPVNLECVVRQSQPLGSHVLFLAEVVVLRADEDIVEDGGVIAGRLAPLAYDPFGGDYWTLKEVVAHHGFSEGRMPPPQKPAHRNHKRQQKTK
jgi:flavin reductase (DIM6/NTAB) family NADH-FMN oxidoreductase RutF